MFAQRFPGAPGVSHSCPRPRSVCCEILLHSPCRNSITDMLLFNTPTGYIDLNPVIQGGFFGQWAILRIARHFSLPKWFPNLEVLPMY